MTSAAPQPHGLMPLSQLVLDKALFPRETLDEVNVRRLIDTLEAGLGPLDPIIADAESFKVVDGFHRHRAYSVQGITEVPVELRTYANQAEMFKDAIRLNTGRGLDLRPIDYARCTLIAEALGISDVDLAAALRVPSPKLDKIREQRIGQTLGHKKLVLKRSLGHLVGHVITPELEALNKRASGMQPVFHVDQLIAFLEANALPEDDRLRVRMTRLGALIDSYIADHI